MFKYTDAFAFAAQHFRGDQTAAMEALIRNGPHVKYAPNTREQYGAHEALRTSNEIAKAVLFLTFDATFTTGAELPVDGGWFQL